LGLAVGNPLLAPWLEMVLVAAAGILPVLWLQLRRPFSVYGLGVLALKPESLSEDQRRVLGRFHSTQHQVLAVAVAIAFAHLLAWLYRYSPIASDLAPFAPDQRLAGLLLAAVALLLANVFAQMAVAAASVLFSPEGAIATPPAVLPEHVRTRFTSIGLPVSHILPPLQWEKKTPAAIVTLPTSSAADEGVSAIEPDAVALDSPKPVLDNGVISDPWETAEANKPPAAIESQVPEQTDPSTNTIVEVNLPTELTTAAPPPAPESIAESPCVTIVDASAVSTPAETLSPPPDADHSISPTPTQTPDIETTTPTDPEASADQATPDFVDASAIAPPPATSDSPPEGLDDSA
jgi:hypothetical protein